MSSGKFVLRIEPELHQSLKDEANRLGESLNSLCQRKLSFSKTNFITEEIPLQKIISIFQPIGIAAFGSNVRGQAKAGSDFDLLIVLNSKNISRAFYKKWDEERFASVLSPHFVSLPELQEPIGSLWLECATEGEILYDPTNELRNYFRAIRIQIANGLYRKKMSHGQGYWVRQEQNAK